MDIIALLAERDKAAQQVNALDTAIRALRGLSSTRVSHGPRKMSAAARARISASGADQSGNTGEMGEVESREEVTASLP